MFANNRGKTPVRRSPRIEVLHKTAAGLARHGAVDWKTMRNIGAICLAKAEPMSGGDIQALRQREGVSQAVMAHHLNVSTKLVSNWERGVKRPSGSSLKLLAIVKARGLDGVT